MNLKAKEMLLQWLNDISDPNSDPWPNNDQIKLSPPTSDAIIIDPTYDFNDASDELEECSESGSESSDDEEDVSFSFTYRGRKDSRGLFDGGGTITFSNGDELMCDFDHGVRHGDGVLSTTHGDLSRICGSYIDGKLQGKGKVIGKDTSVMECVFTDGIVHGGPTRKIELRKFREFRQQLTFAGHYRDGVPAGPCWQYREGGGFLFGVPNRKGSFTGENMAFFYPDLETVIVGEFKDGQLVLGQSAKLKSISFESEIAVPGFAAIPSSVPRVRFSKSTKTSVGDDPLVSDPYEGQMVSCTGSKVDDAGEGLFSVKDVPEGTIVAFYNGVRLPYVLGGPKEDWSTSGYKIFVNADFTSGERMNIPEDCVSLENYKATLGHKMNHSFLANCTEWFFDHPRFGLIPCERTTRPVKAGEELFLDYEYDPYNCPPWFREALESFCQTASEEEIERLNKKYQKFVEFETRER